MTLKGLFSKYEPLFLPEGKYARFAKAFGYVKAYCLDRTGSADGSVPIRDGLSVHRYMVLWVLALLPCLLFGIFNTGAQYFEFKGISAGFFLSFGMGLLCVLPLMGIVLITGVCCVLFFARVHQRPIYPGLLLAVMVYCSMLPPSIAWWKAALGFAFGLVLGQELFGGYGKTFLHPALLGKLFLYVSFPRSVAGDAWTAIASKHLSVLDGKYGINALSVAANLPKGEFVTDVLSRMGQGFWELCLGVVPGGIGDTSVVCVILGAALLWYFRLVNWRIWAGVGVGVFGMSAGLGFLGHYTLNPMYSLPWLWHFLIGGFAFLVVFVASDPSSSPSCDEAKWIFGLGIGCLTVCIRCFHVSMYDGGTLAVLLMMVFRPFVDQAGLYLKFKSRVPNEF